MSKKECNDKDKNLKLICEVEKYYKKDFDNWKDCYQQLIDKTFNKENNTYVKKSNIKWLNEKFINKYKMFKYLKDNGSNVFSFIVMLNKYGWKTRLEIAKEILGNECKDTNFHGVPAGQQGLSEKSFENLEDNKLNELAYQIINNPDQIDMDNEAIKKLTDTFKNVFYILSPEKYFASDKNTKALRKKLEDKNLDNITVDQKNGDYYSRALSLVAWLQKNKIDSILEDLVGENKDKPKNIILTGIPGTGKTHTIMKYLENNYEKEQYEFIQFHPSYDYEDFIEGFKPVASTNGQIEFKLVNGVFKNLCKKAYENKNETYVMVIDEINRANLSRVFGELLYCLEYRDEFVSTKMTSYIQSLSSKQDQELYSISKNNIGKFAIPNNIIILGTMNEVDRSIDAFDLALRRRFIWEEVGFSKTALRLYPNFFKKNFQLHIDSLITKANNLNEKLKNDLGINYQLGHTYFYKIIDYFKVKDSFESVLCSLWKYHLKSIIKEYLKIKYGEDDLDTKLEEYQKIILGNKNDCEN